MAASTHTTHYNLSQFGPDDRPSWIDDYNADMRKLDTALTQGGSQPEPLFCTAEDINGAQFNVSTGSPYMAAFNAHEGNIAVDYNTHTIPITKSGYYSISGYTSVFGLALDSGNDKTLRLAIDVSDDTLVIGVFTKSDETTGASSGEPQLQSCSISSVIVHLDAGDVLTMLIDTSGAPNTALHGYIDTMYLTVESKTLDSDAS